MSTMTLEQALELGYRAGFISACDWPKPCSQDVDSPAFAIELRVFVEKHTPLTRQPKVSEEDVDTALRAAASWMKDRNSPALCAGTMRAALTAVLHNRPAQEHSAIEKCRMVIRQGIKDKSFKGAMYSHALTALHMLNDYDAVVASERPAQEKAEPVADRLEVGDILHRINSECLIGGITDAQFRELASPVLEDIRGYLLGSGYEICTPPAERVRVPDDAEAVSACLGDDAAAMLDANPEDECALNMQRGAQIIDAMLSAAPEGGDHG